MKTIEEHSNYLIRTLFPLSVDKLSDTTVSISNNKYNSKYITDASCIKFYIDDYEIRDGLTYIRGWMFEVATGLPPLAIFVLNKENFLLGLDSVFKKRPDVMAAYKTQLDRVGFEIEFDIFVPRDEIQLVILLSDGRMLSLIAENSGSEQQNVEIDFSPIAKEIIPFIKFNPGGGFGLKEDGEIALVDVQETSIRHHADAIKFEDDMVLIGGWALNRETEQSPYALLLINEHNKVIHMSTDFYSRRDVAKHFGIENKQNFGFKLLFPKLYIYKPFDLYALEERDGYKLTKLRKIR